MNMRNFVGDFGKSDLKPIFETKIRECAAEIRIPRRWTKAQRDYLMARIGPSYVWEIKFSELLRVNRVRERMAYWSRLYLACLPDKPVGKDRLTSSQIQQAREYSTDQLYTDRLIRSGRNQKACCPFHEERSPSFYFYSDGSFHCFGCGAHGSNAVDYVMKLDKKTFPEAVRSLI